MENRSLLQQAVYIPEERIWLKSGHQHDFCSHKWIDAAGKERFYAVDGGTAYCRRVGDIELKSEGRIEEWSLYDDDSFETIASKFLWGTRGEQGDQPLRWVPVAQLTFEHLENILRTQSHIVGTLSERVVYHWWATKSGLSRGDAAQEMTRLRQKWKATCL